jgi:hypothetical protein
LAWSGPITAAGTPCPAVPSPITMTATLKATTDNPKSLVDKRKSSEVLARLHADAR